MRKIVIIGLALVMVRLLPRAVQQQVKAAGLMTMLGTLLAMATNTSKAVSTEQRTTALETRTGNLEQGQITNLQPGSTIGQLASGNFAGQSINCSTLTTTGDITAGNNLGVDGGTVFWPGGVAISTSQASFLSGLRKLNHLGGQPLDGNSGSSWATGERDYINNCVNWINNIDGDLQNKGYMN